MATRLPLETWELALDPESASGSGGAQARAAHSGFVCHFPFLRFASQITRVGKSLAQPSTSATFPGLFPSPFAVQMAVPPFWVDLGTKGAAVFAPGVRTCSC